MPFSLCFSSLLPYHSSCFHSLPSSQFQSRLCSNFSILSFIHLVHLSYISSLGPSIGKEWCFTVQMPEWDLGLSYVPLINHQPKETSNVWRICMVCSNLVTTLQSRQEPTVTVLASLRGWCNSGLSLYRHSLTKERLHLGYPYSSFILVILFVNSGNICWTPIMFLELC